MNPISSIAMRILAVAGLFLGTLFPLSAAATLTVTPITWNVIGLDSNSPATGPQYFPVGARVCSDVATVGGVTSTFVWDSGVTTYIDTRAGTLTSLTLGDLAAGACVDAHYEVQVTRNASSFDKTRPYHITATTSSVTYSTPAGRELYVEHLISQNRNGVDVVLLDGVNIPAGGTMNLVQGNTYAIALNGHTATQGYEQFEAFINFPNVIFQILAVSTSYSAGTPTSSVLYADACTWDNDPTSPSYRACLGSGKTGGTMSSVYVVKIISGAGTSQTLNTLLYDFSGSSFHYNGDFAAGGRIVNILDPAGATMSKAFSPSTTVVGGVSTLTIKLGNTTSGLVTGYNFTDNLPAGMTVANPPSASTSGCGTPVFAPAASDTSLSFTSGSIAGNGTCTISVKVTTSATGTYPNTTNHLFVGTTDTGKFGTASLVVNAAPATTCNSGQLAQWTFENNGVAGTVTNSPTVTTKAFNVTSATSLFANGTASASIVAANGPTVAGTRSWSGGANWQASGTAPNLTTYTGPYFEFLLDTSSYSSGTVSIQFDVDPEANGDWASASNPMWVYVSQDGGTFALASTISVSKGNWTAISTIPAQTPGVSTTTFRIILGGSSFPNKSPTVQLDNVTFNGTCSTYVKPTIAKAFSPNPIAVNGTSTLTFTLTNPNSAQLSGVTFTDTLPSGVQVASSPAASTTCGGTPTWAPTAAATLLTFGSPNGATIPASSSCTVQVAVTATTAGPHDNVSGYISSTESGQNTGPGGSATATLTAVVPPAIAKNFSPDPIIQNGVSKLTFTITNPNLSNAISGVAFSDTFPTSPGQMRVAATPNATTSGCGSPTFAPVAAATSIGFSAGTIAAGGTCTVTVDITAPAIGTYSNTSGNVSHIINAATVNGNAASDSLTVTAPNPAVQLLKQISTSSTGPWTSFISIPAGTSVYYQFTVENAGDVAINLAVGFLADATVSPAGCTWKNGSGTTVTLPAVLPVAVTGNNNHLITCVVGPVTSTSGTHTNTATATATQGGVSCGTPCTDTSSATYQTGAITLTKRAVQSSFAAAGDFIDYEFTVTNVGPAPAGPTVAVSDHVVLGGATVNVTCPSISSVYGTTYLAASQTLVCTAKYTVLAADVTNAKVDNTATATAGGLTSNQATASLPRKTAASRSRCWAASLSTCCCSTWKCPRWTASRCWSNSQATRRCATCR